MSTLLVAFLLVHGTSPLPVPERGEFATAVERHFSVRPDPDAGLDAVALWSSEEGFVAGSGFTPPQDESVRWYRFVLPDSPERLVLGVNRRAMDRRIDLWVAGPAATAPQVCGVNVPFDVRPVATSRCAFRLGSGQGGGKTVLLRVDGRGGLSFDLSREADFFSRELSVTAFYALILGMALVLVASNLLLFARLKDPANLLYAGFVVGIGLNIATLGGLGFQYLWPDGVGLTTWILAGNNAVTPLLALGFTRAFLGTKEKSRAIDRVLRLGMVPFVFALVLLPFVGPPRMEAALGALILVECLGLIAVGVWGARRGFKPARIFILAWSAFLLGIIVNRLATFDLLPYTPLTSRAFMVCAAIQLVLLSLAVADRIELLQLERDAAQVRVSLVERLARYFPRKLVDRILSPTAASGLDRQRKRITLLFSDLQGFTAFTDKTAPDVLARVLNEYLGEMVAVLEAHGGALDKVMGDGLMAHFGAVDERGPKEQAEAAVRCGLAMQGRFKALAEKWRKEGIAHEIRLRIGVHGDEVTVGNFGTESLMSFTAIGGGVNLAARLESSCTPGRVQVSEEIFRLTSGAFPFLPPTEKSLKGFSAPLKVYEVEPA